jgi:hypothetical protein
MAVTSMNDVGAEPRAHPIGDAAGVSGRILAA